MSRGLLVLGFVLLALPARADTPIYYVRALGPVDAVHTNYACKTITRVFRVRCQVLRPMPLPHNAFDGMRGQYAADSLVQRLFDDLPRDAIGLTAVTNADLYDASHSSRFVFGLASLLDHTAVVSLARFRGTWWGEAIDPGRFKERFYKVLIHEVAHTVGLSHCENRRCAMRDDKTLADLDASPHRFCARCQKASRAGLQVSAGTGRWHYMRGHSHLNRAHLARAVFHFERAAELLPDDVRIVNDLGVAYLRRGDAGRALWCFRHARTLDPNFPSAYFNEGLVFLRAGEPSEAQRAFEGALVADSDWGPAHRQLGYLYQEVLGDQTQALAHYQAYLDANGADSAIEARVQMIKGGGVPAAPQ